MKRSGKKPLATERWQIHLVGVNRSKLMALTVLNIWCGKDAHGQQAAHALRHLTCCNSLRRLHAFLLDHLSGGRRSQELDECFATVDLLRVDRNATRKDCDDLDIRR